MRTSIGRLGTAVLNRLLPAAEAQACTPGFCEQRDGKGKRCCRICTGGQKICAAWGTGCASNCSGY